MPLIHQCFPAHQNELEQSSNFQVHQHKHQHKANVTQPVISFYFSFLKKILFYDLLMFFPNSPIYFSPNSNRPLNCLILIALISLLCLFFCPVGGISRNIHEQGCKTTSALILCALSSPGCRNHGQGERQSALFDP